MYNIVMEITETIRAGGMSVKEYLLDCGYSVTQIKRFKYCGQITVNGNPVTVRHILAPNDRLVLYCAETVCMPQPCDVAAIVPYCDGRMYVAIKPYGVAVHPDLAHRNDTLGNMLAAYFGDGFALRIITRLDRTTSGLVLGALDPVTANALNLLQQRHEITKQYVAVVQGVIQQNHGTIELPLKRLPENNITVVSDDGKYARTDFAVTQRLRDRTVVRLYPQTGRTHQIRAHLAAMGHPIVGDVLYGAASAERIMLHCEMLRFVNPFDGKIAEFTSAADFAPM